MMWTTWSWSRCSASGGLSHREIAVSPDLADAGRWNSNGTALRLVFLLPPRDIRLTTTVEL